MQQQQQAAPPAGQAQVSRLERELPMLAGIGAFVTWCEDLLAVLSGPILTAGLAIALVDLLSDGQLFTRLPVLLWVWAGSMALGLDAQFIGSSAKLARAMRQRRPWVATGYTILCLALGYVAFLATYVFAVQEANGISTSEALSRLGMDSTTWIFQRSILAVILVFLSGLLRYVPPATDDALAAQTEAERLDREIQLAPKRAQLRAMQARGLRETAAAFRGREQPAPTTIRPVAAAATLPLTETLEHHVAAASAYKAMHGEWPGDAPSEVVDEVYDEDDDPDFGGWGTSVTDQDDLIESMASTTAPNDTKRRSRTQGNSGPTRRSSPASKLARETQKKVRQDAKQARKRQVREGSFAVFNELAASGESLSLDGIGRRVREMYHLETTPSNNTIMRLRGAWNASRIHRGTLDDVPPMEPQELRELQEVW